MQESFANVCSDLTPEERYNDHAAIVLAKVVEKESFSTTYSHDGKDYELYGETYVLDNLQNYKGNLPVRFNLTSQFDSTASYDLDLGVTYFLNGHNNSDNTSMNLINCGAYSVDFDEEIGSIDYSIPQWYIDTHEEFVSYYESQINPEPKEVQRFFDWLFSLFV